jgi:hypothetical protein
LRKNEKINIGTHPRLDPDTIAATWIKMKKEGKKPEDVEILPIFTGGNESVMVELKNVEVIDRGLNELDHHVKGRSEQGETSTSLMAKKCGMSDDEEIQRLIGEIRRNDLQGITLPFTFCHIIKCGQKNSNLTDKERMAIGLRVIDDAMEFRKRGLQRENLWVQKILIQFLEESEEKFVPEDFQRYTELLAKERFERLFDFVEILVAEKVIRGEKEARRFAKVIAQLIYKPSYNHYRAMGLVERTLYKKRVGDILVVANDPDDPSSKDKDVIANFSSAARRYARMEERAAVVIQYSKGDGTQISFDIDARYKDNQYVISNELIKDIVAVIRLEECLIRGRGPQRLDLASPGTLEQIPEWHFFCPPSLGKKRAGRFIFNRSLTSPDVPLSKIPFKTLFDIVYCTVKFQPLNWQRWVAERVSLYKK